MNHSVKQGEHLSSISRKYGFSDYRKLWNHPQNAELKKKRRNPNILFPGDVLYIPDLEYDQVACVTEKRHVFQVVTDRLKLRLILEDIYRGPISNASCELQLTRDTLSLRTDSEGRLDHEIQPTCEIASLVIRDAESPLKDRVIKIQIGYLDPLEEASGQAARLKNLGYYRASVDEIDEREFRSAVEEFQCDQGLAVDGDCGPNTQAMLKSVHGC